jgi:N utilization substance protein B
MTRSEARKNVLELLFEREFRNDESDEAIFATSCESREIGNNGYIKNAYFGVCNNVEAIDEEINKNAKGWKVNRLSKVSRSILRLCIYEMLYEKDIPLRVSINEGVELAKIYEDEKARAFINGVLNAVKNGIGKEKDEK